MDKTINHKAKNGLELKIVCSVEFPKHAPYGTTIIEVVADGIKHKYPQMSSVKGNILHLKHCTYKGKKVGGISDIDGLQEWYDNAKALIKSNKQKALNDKIQKDKNVEEVEFSVHTSYGTSTTNEYLKSLGFNDLSKDEIKQVEAIAERTDVDVGDYSTTTYYVAPMVKIIEVLESIKAQRADKKRAKHQKEIDALQKRIDKKDIPFQNIYAIDKDLSTGLTYYTFIKKVDRVDFNKVRKYFEFIESYKNDFDPMNGTKFRGYATTQPEKVCDILYPNWREEGIKEMELKLEELTND